MFLENSKIRPLITRSWLGQTLYLPSLLTIKPPTHWHTHNRVNSFTLNTERERERERESHREDEWRGEGGVCDWSFGLHSIVASGYIASWLVKHLLQRGYTVKATVRDTSQCLSLSLSNLYQPVTMSWNCIHFFNLSFLTLLFIL